MRVREAAPEPVPVPAAAAAIVPDLEPDLEVGRLEASAAESRVRSWLIAGWAVTVGAVALGAWMSWTVNSDSGLYSGRIDPSTEILRTLGWSLSPALLMAGAFGAVVVTGLAALLEDWRVGASPNRRTLPADSVARRRGGVCSRFVAGGLALIVWSVGLTTEGNAASMQLVWSGDGTLSDGQQAKFTSVALGQFAQTTIGPLAFAVIAAFVAIVWSRCRGSARDAHDERGGSKRGTVRVDLPNSSPSISNSSALGLDLDVDRPAAQVDDLAPPVAAREVDELAADRRLAQHPVLPRDRAPHEQPADEVARLQHDDVELAVVESRRRG